MGLNESSDGEKLRKSEKSSLAGVDFDEFPQGSVGALKRKKGPKKTPTALFRVGGWVTGGDALGSVGVKLVTLFSTVPT